MAMSKVAQLSLVHTDIHHCTLCELHAGRTLTVPGAGNPDADVMFIGEAPGKNEDEQGLPFVGRSGNYLEERLKDINLSREDVFIANVVKCRPPDNRDPRTGEIATCNPYLRRQIDIIDPLVIATLGRFSMEMFFGKQSITRIHGQFKYGDNRAYIPLFHPAYVLRNPNIHDDFVTDMQKLLPLVEDVRLRREKGEMHAGISDVPTPDVPDNVNDEAEEVAEDDPDSPKQMGLFG